MGLKTNDKRTWGDGGAMIKWFKKFFNKLFCGEKYAVPLQEKRPKSRIRGDVILCHDCQRIGYSIPYGFGNCELPDGWMNFDIGFSRLYLCRQCLEKRRQFGMNLLRESTENNKEYV